MELEILLRLLREQEKKWEKIATGWRISWTYRRVAKQRVKLLEELRRALEDPYVN